MHSFEETDFTKGQEPTLAWAHLAQRFNANHRKSAESVVEMGKVVYEAKTELKDKDYALFAADVRIDGSTQRKYERIGRYAPTLEEHIDCLPRNWTSIYELTMAEEKLVEALAIVRPNMSSKEIRAVVQQVKPCSILNKVKPAKPREENRQTSQPDIAFKLACPLSPAMIIKLQDELSAVFRRLGVDFETTLSDTLLDLVDQFTAPISDNAEPQGNEVQS